MAGLFNTGTNFLMKLLRMNCDFPDACPAQPHIKVDKDNPYEAEIRIMAEMQLARRNNCSPFLLQVPWGKHNPVDWRGQHAAQGLEGVDVDGVLPVVVVKDPFTWMRSMCRMDLCGNQVMHRGPGFGSNSDMISERYTRPTGPSGTSRNPRHASH